MAEELNQMSQMYEELQAKLKQRDGEQAENKDADASKRRESDDSKVRADSESSGTAAVNDPDNVKDASGQVKGGVKRAQGGILGVDMAGVTASPANADKEEEEEADTLPSIPLKFQAHDSEVPMIRFDETGSRLFTCSCDGTIKVWDAWGGAIQKTLRSPVDVQLMGMDVREKIVIGTGSDRTVRIWNLDTERVVHTLTGHASKLYACRLTPDARTAVSGGTDRKVMTWDVPTGNRLRLISCSSIINAVAVSEDGTYIATGHQDTSMRMWDLRSGKMALAVTDCHTSTVTSVEFTRSNKILTNSRDNTLSLVDLVAAKTESRFSDLGYKVAYNWSTAD
ncbi:MAG TPA: WD40 repeat domain-containing protein, partial [Blastocatellia bacterium]|nr:WD40 repeat domain-containing protein [Blastocatellia bacterium]